MSINTNSNVNRNPACLYPINSTKNNPADIVTEGTVVYASHSVATKSLFDVFFSSRYQSFNYLLRVTAQVLKFINNLKHATKCTVSQTKPLVKNSDSNTAHFTVSQQKPLAFDMFAADSKSVKHLIK